MYLSPQNFSSKIDLENRYMNDNGSRCLLTVDGTDFKILEPTPFSHTWYSFKFKHAGLRYEIAICIQTGWICWVNGPFKPGQYNDHQIFQLGLDEMLDNGERVEVDNGYNGNARYSRPNDCEGNNGWGRMKANARARHENVNGKLKEFNILEHTFRNERGNHTLFFHAVVAVVQFSIMNGSTTYQIDYTVGQGA